MREASRGNLRGVHGPVANLVRADAECALAIETALGGAAQNIVVDTQNDGRSAIELLKRADAGRATFLPLDAIRGTVITNAPERDHGFVGVAFDLARFDDKYKSVFANLLGRTVVAETLADAVRMAKQSGNTLRIVTLDGQLINAGGSMTGGSAARGSGILARERAGKAETAAGKACRAGKRNAPMSLSGRSPRSPLCAISLIWRWRIRRS